MPSLRRPARTYPKPRLDALTDGVFAVAMTLLVLEIRLPAHAELADSAALLAALQDLWPEFLAYAISFFVLGVRWRATLDVRTAQEVVPRDDVRWWLAYLFLVTCLPFTTSVVGHYGGLAPAVWLYAGNLILIALAFLPITIGVAPHESAAARAHRMRQYVLIVSAVVSVGISFIAPVWAMLAYLLNILGEPLAAWAAHEGATDRESGVERDAVRRRDSR